MSDIPDAVRGWFPQGIRADADAAASRLIFPPPFPTTECFPVVVGGETIFIPYRVYFSKAVADGLSPIQQDILSCIFTRHSSGWIRQAAVRRVIDAPHDWVIPYVLQLVGEYVIEITWNIHASLSSKDLSPYRRFVAVNPAFYSKTKQRVISYWDCYYRHLYPKREDYPGCRILRLIEGADHAA